MIHDPRTPFRPLADHPAETAAWSRWEHVDVPRATHERERFQMDTLAERKTPAARPAWFSRLFRRHA